MRDNTLEGNRGIDLYQIIRSIFKLLITWQYGLIYDNEAVNR